jgi:hypothetical protein
VHHQEDQPEADHDALLDQEEVVSLTDQPVHDRVGFASAALHPDQREERVEDVQHEDADEQRDVRGVEAIDVDVPGLALSPPRSPAPHA